MTDILTQATEIAAAESARLDAEQQEANDLAWAAYLADERTASCNICHGIGEVRMETGRKGGKYWATRCSCRRTA